MNKTEIKCPYCGSTNTAEILYGMPVFSEELQEKLDAGEIVLGGCCINSYRNEDGEWINLDPTRYCNCCKKEF